MSGKRETAKKTRKKQKELESTQKKALGMDPNTEGTDYDKHAIYFPSEVENAKEESLKQNGRIEAVESALNKDSTKRKDYKAMKNNNEKFLNHIKNLGNNNQ